MMKTKNRRGKTAVTTEPLPRQLSRPKRLAALLLATASVLAAIPMPADTLYVSSVNGNKIYRLSSTGTVTAFATISLLPEGLAFGTNGLLDRFQPVCGSVFQIRHHCRRSTNLSLWATLFTVTNDGSVCSYVNEGPGSAVRFYRLTPH